MWNFQGLACLPNTRLLSSRSTASTLHTFLSLLHLGTGAPPGLNSRWDDSSTHDAVWHSPSRYSPRDLVLIRCFGCLIGSHESESRRKTSAGPFHSKRGYGRSYDAVLKTPLSTPALDSHCFACFHLVNFLAVSIVGPRCLLSLHSLRISLEPSCGFECRQDDDLGLDFLLPVAYSVVYDFGDSSLSNVFAQWR